MGRKIAMTVIQILALAILALVISGHIIDGIRGQTFYCFNLYGILACLFGWAIFLALEGIFFVLLFRKFFLPLTLGILSFIASAAVTATLVFGCLLDQQSPFQGHYRYTFSDASHPVVLRLVHYLHHTLTAVYYETSPFSLEFIGEIKGERLNDPNVYYEVLETLNKKSEGEEATGTSFFALDIDPYL